MPLTQPQLTILTSIEQELKVLKEFTENKENELLPLLDLIGSKKSKKLVANCKNLQKIFLRDDDVKIRQAILSLFQADKNKGLIKQLGEIKDEFEKLNQDQKKVNAFISTYKNSQEIDGKLKYIDLRIIHRKRDIDKLIKFKQLIDLATNEDNKQIILDHLQTELMVTGLKGPITFNNLNTVPDWEQALKEIKQKLPTTKVISNKTSQPKPNNIPITTSESDLLEMEPETPINTSVTQTTSEEIDEQANQTPLLEAFIAQQEQISALEKAFEFIKKDHDILHSEKNELEKAVVRLQEIKSRLEEEKSSALTRDSILKTFRNLKLSDINEVTKENQSLKEDKQKIEQILTEKETKLVELSKQKVESDQKLTENIETISSELESTKKLLEDARTNLCQKDIDLEKIAIQLQETEKSVSALNSLQSDLSSANEKVTELNSKQDDLKNEITKLHDQNQKLQKELQENLDRNTAQENELMSLNETLQNDKSASKEVLIQQTLEIKKLKLQYEKSIQELQSQVEINCNTIKNLEDKFQQKTAELNRLQEQLESQKAFKTEIEALKKSSDETAKTISLLNDEKEKLNKDLNYSKEVSQNLALEINNLQDELDKLRINDSFNQEAISKLTNQIKGLNEFKLKQEKLISELQNQLKTKDTEIMDLGAQDQQKIEELIQINTKLIDTQNALKKSENKIATLKTEKNELKKNNSINKEEISQLEKQLDELSKLKSQQETHLQELNDQIKIKENIIAELKTTMEKSDAELVDSRKQVRNLELAKSELENLKLNLESQITELNIKNTELQQKNDELNQLSGQLEAFKTEVDALQKSSEEAAETLSVLKSEKGKLNKDLNDAQEILRNSKFEIARLQVELEKLRKNDSSNQEAISKLTNKISDLENLGLQKEESIRELTQKIAINASLIAGQATQLESLSKTLGETQGKSGQLENRNGQLEEQTIKMQKNIDQLTNGAIALSSQIKELTIEKENLNQKLKDAQEALQTSKSEINNLQVEIEKQQTNKSTDKEQISKLTKQLDELNKLKSQQEKLISELQSQLISKNAELKELFDQHSVNDALITDLKNTISIYKNKLTVAKEAIATVNEKLETKQKDDSNLKVDYAKLDKELSEKILELNKIQTELKSTKEQLEEALAKNITQGGLTMPGTQTNLIDFENQMPNQDHPDQVYSNTNFLDENGSSSGHFSRQSSSNSHASSENINTLFNPLFSHNQNPSSEDEAFAKPYSLRTNSSNSSLTRSHSLPNFAKPSVSATTLAQRPTVPIINPKNNGTTMTRLEQPDAQVDNTSSIHARGVINAFKKENHEQIRLAFTAEFSRIATAAANLLFNENIVANADLPTFTNELDAKANKEVQDLIFALSNNKELLSGIIEKIHTEGLNASTYLEEVKNSASFIFGTLTIKRQGEADQTYKDYIKDIGENLLINLCTENLQTEEKTNLLQIAKQKLKSKIITNNLQPIEQHTETIKIAAEELVTNILKVDKLKNIIEDANNDPIDGVNLLEASKQKLQEQLEQEVDQTFEYYFPIVHLNPIFQKIKDGEELTEEEIQKIPSELQYADSIKDFVSGLRVKYSHLSSDYEGKIDDNNFKNLRLILRKKALADTNPVIPKDNEIIDLDAKAWLEKKLQLITGKSVNLALVKLEKEQENLLNELSSSLHISTFYDIAITRKTIPELTQEIEKANKAQSSTAEQISQIYKEIESKQTAYPKLIDDEAIAGFRANLNQHLENSSIALEVNNKQTETLLMGINQRLKKDISKWGFLDNKLQKEITNDIANTNGFPFDETATEKLVQHAMLVLRDNYPNETIEKRKQWLKDIALLHAITKKLATFSPKIKENIAKFEDLRVRKEEDVNQLEEPVANKIADAVYLPHRHTIIASSLDPNLAKRLPADFELLEGAFYKQDPLQIGQTLTFALSLHNGEEQKCSVTRDETCLAYKIHTPWLNIVNKIKDGVANKMTYARSNTNSSKQFNTEEETLFTLLTHAVNSSKGPTHTIMLGKNCSNEKERFIRLFVEKFNAEQKLSSKKTILLANANDKLKIHLDDKKTIYNKIHKANSLTEEFDNATTRTIDTLNRHITRPRG